MKLQLTKLNDAPTPQGIAPTGEEQTRHFFRQAAGTYDAGNFAAALAVVAQAACLNTRRPLPLGRRH